MLRRKAFNTHLGFKEEMKKRISVRQVYQHLKIKYKNGELELYKEI